MYPHRFEIKVSWSVLNKNSSILCAGILKVHQTFFLAFIMHDSNLIGRRAFVMNSAFFHHRACLRRCQWGRSHATLLFSSGLGHAMLLVPAGEDKERCLLNSFNSVKVQWWKDAHRENLDSKGLMNSTKFLYFYETLWPCHSPLGGFRSRISAIFLVNCGNDFRCRAKISGTWKWKIPCVYKVMMSTWNNCIVVGKTNVRALSPGNAATDSSKTNVNTKIKTSSCIAVYF